LAGFWIFGAPQAMPNGDEALESFLQSSLGHAAESGPGEAYLELLDELG
jgi:hypothetical protein